MILSLHDSDMLRQCEGGNYLKRTVAMLRSSVKPPLPARNNMVDKDIRLLLDVSGPSFKHKTAVERPGYARRVGNLWYTLGFGQRLFEEMLLNHAKVRGTKVGTGSDPMCRTSGS